MVSLRPFQNTDKDSNEQIWQNIILRWMTRKKAVAMGLIKQCSIV